MCEIAQKFTIFIRELFSIGNSAGSLIVEACNLMKTFQRLSATKTFSAHFSSQCLSMFNWANIAIEGMNAVFFDSDPFTEFEIFYLLTCVFPVFILVFLTAITIGYRMYFAFLLYGISIMLGVGFGYLRYNNKKALLIIIPCVVIILVCICAYKIIKVIYRVLERRNKYQFTFAVLGSCIILTGILAPILVVRVGFTLVYVSIVSGFCFFSMLIEFIVHVCDKYSSTQIYKVKKKSYLFGINCFTLLLVPATDSFIGIMNNYGKIWNVIAVYVGNTILLPIIMTVFLIIFGFSGIKSKYKDLSSELSYYIYFIELIDIARQVLYSVVGGFDLPWACIVIELGWVVLILCIWPYENKSDYSLSFGNSAIMFLSNGLALYANYSNKLYFNFTVSIILISLACLPAIISIYLYFIADFKFDDSDSDSILEGSDLDSCDDSSEINCSLLEYTIFYITPFAWFFYGMAIPLMTEKIFDKNE